MTEVEKLRWKQLLQALILASAVVLSMGTSKALFGKRLGRPRVAPLPGVVVGEKTQVWLRENVNNQGCLARQRIDFVASLRLRNTSPNALRVAAENVELRLDGKRKPLERATFYHQEAGKKHPTRGVALPAGTRGELVLVASSVCAKKQLKKVREVTLVVPLGVGTLRLSFERLSEQKLVRYR